VPPSAQADAAPTHSSQPSHGASALDHDPPHDRRARLLPLLPVLRVPGRVVRGTSTRLIRKERYAEPTLGPVLAASLGAHTLLLLAICYKAASSMTGSPASPPAQPVEMLFDQAPASTGMTGPTSPEAAGGNAARTPAQSSNAPAPPAEAQEGPQHSNTEQPSSPTLPQSNDGLLRAEEKTQHTAPAKPVTGHSHQPRRPAHPAPHPRPTPSPSHHTPSPLDYPMDTSFDQAPAPRRPRRGRSGGSNAPLDLSIGPMVENGALTAHYSSRTAVHGVSSDYAAEIDAWIQRHLYYPPEAAERGDSGTTSVHVVLDRQGNVFKVFETSSSGVTELDAATVGMFHGAQLPPVPPDMKDNYINFDVTINYILIRN
jgi:protein TonB